LIRSSKPCIAAINGASIGVGLTQVLPMDYLVASEDAKLSARFIKMGVVPELASSKFLVARMGFGHASELMLTGKTINGTEAAEIRLIDKAVPADQLMTAARDVAKAMGENPQGALQTVKQLITENMTESDLREVQKRELAALEICYKSVEHKEAINAFIEKRDPDFREARKR
jgi:2-(1,2-epoxy-1,2-dihydrophenyl)acetyl-CoA isomerase